jgi:hypothetical protein
VFPSPLQILMPTTATHQLFILLLPSPATHRITILTMSLGNQLKHKPPTLGMILRQVHTLRSSLGRNRFLNINSTYYSISFSVFYTANLQEIYLPKFCVYIRLQRPKQTLLSGFKEPECSALETCTHSTSPSANVYILFLQNLFAFLF